MKKVFTGIGARKTPIDILAKMVKIAGELNSMGFYLRSGGADGADMAFEGAYSENFCISYRPWHILHKNTQRKYTREQMDAGQGLASRFHGNWSACSSFVRRLHGRSSFQVLGVNLDSPVDFVICWTPDGCESHLTRSIKTGGTGTAIAIASTNGIPVFNLKNADAIDRLHQFLKS